MRLAVDAIATTLSLERAETRLELAPKNLGLTADYSDLNKMQKQLEDRLKKKEA